MTDYTSEDIEIWTSTADKLSGKNRRVFMAKVVKRLGRGGQRFAAKELGWCRSTIRKGNDELNGKQREGNLSNRGRKKAEFHNPNLLNDIRDIVEAIAQTDPSFRSTQLFSLITAKEILRRLKDDKAYELNHLPCIRTIHNKMKDLNFRLRKVQKSKPFKKKSLKQMPFLKSFINLINSPIKRRQHCVFLLTVKL